MEKEEIIVLKYVGLKKLHKIAPRYLVWRETDWVEIIEQFMLAFTFFAFCC